MQVLSPNDLKLFKNLLEASPEKLMRMLNRILCGRYSNLTYTGDYLYAIGDIPIGLVEEVLQGSSLIQFFQNRQKIYITIEKKV